MDQNTIQALKQAAEHIKSGKNKAARAILIKILRQDAKNAQAWYMMSFAIPVVERQIYALEQVLSLVPDNEKARTRLEELKATLPTEEAPPTKPLPPIEEPPSYPPQQPIETEPVSTQEDDTPSVDLLSQRLFGEDAPAHPQVETASSPLPQSTFIDSGENEEEEEEEKEAQAKKAKQTSKRNRLILFGGIGLVLIVLLVLALVFSDQILGLVASPTVDPTQIENTAVAVEQQTEEAIPTVTPTNAPTATTQPTPTPIVLFDTDDLSAPGTQAAGQLLEIEDQVSSLLGISELPNIDTYLLSNDRFQPFLWDFAKIPSVVENAQAMESLLVSLGLAQPADDFTGFYQNVWADPNGTLFLPSEGLIAIEGFELSVYQKYSYAQAFVQSLRDHEYDFETLGVFPTCDLTDQACEAALAYIKGEAAFSAMRWATDNLDADTVSQISESKQKLFILPVQSPPNVFEQFLNFPYQFGFTFAEAVFAGGNFDGLEAAYLNLPTTTEQILHPDKYLTGEAGAEVADTSLESFLPEEWTPVFSDALGEWKTLLLLTANENPTVRLTTEVAEPAAAGWGGDYTQIYQNTAGDNILAARWTWDTQTDQVEFTDALTQYTNKLVGGAQIEIEGYTCLQSVDGVSCIIPVGSDTIWVFGAQEDSVQLVIQNYALPIE